MLMDAKHHRIKLVDFGCARDLECEGEVSVMGGTAGFVGTHACYYYITYDEFNGWLYTK